MSNYARNKARAITRNTEPTLTEQSMAKDTDINVIVGRFRITGRVPGAQGQPMSGDFTQMPDDLRGYIEAAKGMKKHWNGLPEKLRNLPMDKLLALTPTELTNILTPPAQPPAQPPAKEPAKEETK